MKGDISLFKIGDLVTCKYSDKYSYTTKGVICEIVDIYENSYYDIYVRILETNGYISERHVGESWEVESEYFELINKKENNIDEWR